MPVRGDRRDRYEAEADIWEIVTRIAIGRKARELDPVFETLRTCTLQAEGDRNISPVVRKRLAEMHAFTSSVDRWFAQMLNLPRGKLKILLKLGAKVANLLPLRQS